MAKAKEIPYTQEQLRELLDYDPDTGVLRWRELYEGHGYHNMKASHWNNQFAGKVVGMRPRHTSNGYTYNSAFICGKHYKAHRVIWKWMTGEDVRDGVLDHINRDGTDNRWTNMRLCTGTPNEWNRSRHANNTSGYSGVYWRNDSKKWRATVCAKGIKENLGSFVDKQGAIDAVRERRKELGFDPEHGQIDAHYRTAPKEKVPLKTSSGITHINWCEAHQKYKVRITIDGKRRSGGYHETLEGACLKLLEMKLENDLPIDFEVAAHHKDVIGW